MTHIIRQQYLHVAVNGTESDGLALQRSLPALCQHWLMPAIERVLDRCGPQDGDLYVERLEVDAGTLTLERLEHDIAESVTQALEKSLREQIPRGQSSPTILSSDVQHKTAEHSINEAFIYFLKTGSLPWSFRLRAGESLEQVILGSWEKAGRSGVSPYGLHDAVLPLLASATIRNRLTRQFSVGFLATLLSLLSPEDKKVLDGILQKLHSSDGPAIDLNYFERRLWETVFTNVAVGGVLTPTHLVGEAWRSLPPATVGHDALERVLDRHWPGALNTAPPNRFERSDHRPPNLHAAEKTSIAPSEHPEAKEGIYIDNAGLVLLHPFLPQLFATLGLAAEDKLLQPERALCLLHFVTTGQPIAPEYESMLAKILCNIALETPVESNLELTDLEKEEAGSLLEAVINHWEALGNTAIDGLRGTFLLRSGKVSLREDGDWLLQVEANSFDILLDQLPWGLSMIKLPWMEKMLWVEWR